MLELKDFPRLVDDSAGRPAAARPGALTRFRALLRRRSLDRALADGSDPLESPELALRASQLSDRRNRERLADAIESILIEATEPPRARSAAIQVPRQAVEEARIPLIRIATMLSSEGPVYCRGLALLEILLTDGASPLWGPTEAGQLDEELARILAALRGRGPRDQR